VVAALGVTQILGWGSSFYLPAVLAEPIVRETGWPFGWVVGGVTLGLLTAGLISPWVGRIIARHGGRPMLAASSVVFALGLASVALASNIAVYVAAWIVIGAAMGMGLYDAVFAALGRLYGDAARGPITSVTLIGGFAGTVCWPLSALLLDLIGWRGVCLAYAALHLAVALPLQFVMPMAAGEPAPATLASSGTSMNLSAPERTIFWLTGIGMVLTSAIGAVFVIHLLILLQAKGLALAAAVSIGALFGPGQVGARLVERLFGHSYHPAWTVLASATLMLFGLALLWGGAALAVPAVVLFAAGYGVSWVARGTLPLAVFGPQRYPVIVGRLALPSLIAQALAPAAGALALDRLGAEWLIVALAVLAIANALVTLALWRRCVRPKEI
jgi:MFS family permease